MTFGLAMSLATLLYLSPPGTGYSRRVIAPAEEISFRGYIQSRFAGLISNRWVRTLVVAVIFGAVHAPLQSIIQHVPVLSYVQRNWLSLSLVCVTHFYLLYVYPRELLPWNEGSTQIDLTIQWENQPTTIYVEMKYGSDVSERTAGDNGQHGFCFQNSMTFM
jgi:hypothetical protein